MAIMSKLTAAYLAGLIDGEGYIGIMRMKTQAKQSTRGYFYVPVLKVTMADERTIRWLYDSFGGSFEVRKAHGNARESYGWMCRKAGVQKFVRYLYPYLRIKRRQAECIFQFAQATNGSGHKLSSENWDIRDKLYEEIRSLNRRGAA